MFWLGKSSVHLEICRHILFQRNISACLIIDHTKIEESSHQNIHFGYFESFVFSLNHYFCWTIHLIVLKCIKWCQKHCAAAKDITFWKVWKFVGEISITLSLQNYFWWNLSICQTTRQMAKDKTR